MGGSTQRYMGVSDLKFNIKELTNKKKLERIKNIKENVKKLVSLRNKEKLSSDNIIKLYSLRKNILLNNKKQFKNISFNYKSYLTNLDNINLNYVSSYNIFVNKNLNNSYLNYNNLKLDYIKCVFNLNYNLYTINY